MTSSYRVFLMNQIEVISTVRRRRNFTAQDKAQYVALTMQHGNTISSVAREYGIAPNQLYKWRNLMENGGMTAVGANDQVVSMAEYTALLKK